MNSNCKLSATFPPPGGAPFGATAFFLATESTNSWAEVPFGAAAVGAFALVAAAFAASFNFPPGDGIFGAAAVGAFALAAAAFGASAFAWDSTESGYA